MYLPSGDHCGERACPERVSGMVSPVFCFHIHRSLRKRLCCQSGDAVAITAAEPSGDNFASLDVGGVHELVQRDQVFGGLRHCWDGGQQCPGKK